MNPGSILKRILEVFWWASKKNLDESLGRIVMEVLVSEKAPAKFLILEGFDKNLSTIMMIIQEGLWWKSLFLIRILEGFCRDLWKDLDRNPERILMRILEGFWKQLWKEFEESPGRVLRRLLKGFRLEFWKDSDDNFEKYSNDNPGKIMLSIRRYFYENSESVLINFLEDSDENPYMILIGFWILKEFCW